MRQWVALLVGLIALSPLARAGQYDGYYVGAGVGRSTLGALGSATGLQAFIGYDFNQFLGIETDYLHSGNMKAGGSGLGLSTTDTLTGAEASLLAKLPLYRRFAVFARIGGIYWHDDGSITVFANSFGVFPISASASGTSFAWGGGGEAFLDRFALRAEFQQAQITGVTYRFVGASLIYRF